MQSMGSQRVRHDLETEQQQPLTGGISVSYGSSIFNFIRSFHSGLNSDFIILHSHQNYTTFRIKLHTHQRCSEGSNKTLCAPGPRNPTETEPELPLRV